MMPRRPRLACWRQLTTYRLYNVSLGNYCCTNSISPLGSNQVICSIPCCGSAQWGAHIFRPTKRPRFVSRFSGDDCSWRLWNIRYRYAILFNVSSQVDEHKMTTDGSPPKMYYLFAPVLSFADEQKATEEYSASLATKVRQCCKDVLSILWCGSDFVSIFISRAGSEERWAMPFFWNHTEQRLRCVDINMDISSVLRIYGQHVLLLAAKSSLIDYDFSTTRNVRW